MTNKIVDISDARKERIKEASAHVNAEVGGLVDETNVAICIYGEELIPEEVSELLGLNPTHAHRKGDRKKPSSSHVFKTGVWIFELRGGAPKGPEELTVALLDRLPPTESVWTELASRYRVELRYGLHLNSWNRGFDISQRVVEKIAEIHATVGFDIYAILEDEDE